MYQTKTPILLLIFKRPHTTEKVFNAIRSMRPKKLYIASDGVRSNKQGEKELNEQCKKIVGNIDWDCEIKILYRKENLGSAKAISEAITWFFCHEEQGIILEDDCLPNESFFLFCDELLEKYKDNEAVWSINGSNFEINSSLITNSYGFSYYPQSWGWATWRRTWEKFDMDILKNNQKEINSIVNKTSSQSIKWKLYWKATFSYARRIPNWDYQFIYTCWKNNGLVCIPQKNLISNIGFGFDAVHTTSDSSPLAKIKATSLDYPFAHPSKIENSQIINKHFDKVLYNISYMNIMKYWIIARFPVIRTFHRKYFR